MYIAAIDQGTTSTRCILFDHAGLPVTSAQKEHQQIYPRPGWVEHDPVEIWQNTQEVISLALAQINLTAANIAAVGITNQRETTVLWDVRTGKPVHNAIVWQDTRTDPICAELGQAGGQDRFRQKTGLPLANYFSGTKITWLLQNIPDLADLAKAGYLRFGNIDSWLVWNLTGGVNGGIHITDCTNASRTLLMDLKTLQWDPEILQVMGIPPEVLPAIRSSSEVYGTCKTALPGVPIAGILGDQQAALFGQTCFSPGEAKNTYGTGCFMLMNTGEKVVHSCNGLLTTLGYRLGQSEPVYCLEGSIAITGALVQWIRDNLHLIHDSSEIEALARQVPDNGDVYFVPAFAGLYAPYWRSDARGAILGLTRFATAAHIARAALEAVAYQTREVFDAMVADSGVHLSALKVDGGMVVNALLMQFQADILRVPVTRPVVAETTALGAAYAAGLATGYWQDQADLKKNWKEQTSWRPLMDEKTVDHLYSRWKKAVQKSMNWVD
jgi:glycerol kinase